MTVGRTGLVPMAVLAKTTVQFVLSSELVSGLDQSTNSFLPIVLSSSLRVTAAVVTEYGSPSALVALVLGLASLLVVFTTIVRLVGVWAGSLCLTGFPTTTLTVEAPG